MRKVEYRCNHCMIVEAKWLLNSDRQSDYISCRKCGMESHKIGTEEVSRPNYTSLDKEDGVRDNTPKFL